MPRSIAQMRAFIIRVVPELELLRAMRGRMRFLGSENRRLKQNNVECQAKVREYKTRHEVDQHIIWKYQRVFALLQDTIKTLDPSMRRRIAEVLDPPRKAQTRRKPPHANT